MHVQFRIGRFPFLGLCCALLAASLIGRHVLAQKPTAPEPKLTTTTVADNRYGEGGTKETKSDEKFQIHQVVWKNKDGKKREVYALLENGAEALAFFKDDGDRAFIFQIAPDPDNRPAGRTLMGQADVLKNGREELSFLGQSQHRSRQECESLIEKIEKQFARDGTIPPDLFTKKEEEKEVETNVEQPQLQRLAECLIGIWECKSFNEGNRFFTGGGTGFRVTFNKDGTETVDYSSMQPIKAGPIDKIAYTGTASARISTLNGVAKIESMHKAGVMMTVDSTGRHFTQKIPTLGPGGLGSADKSSYTCSGDSLEYQTSTRLDRHANCTVKFTRVKPP